MVSGQKQIRSRDCEGAGGGCVLCGCYCVTGVGSSSQTLGERMPGRTSPLGMIQKSSRWTVVVVTTAGGKGLLLSHCVERLACVCWGARLRLVVVKPWCVRGSFPAWLPSSPPSRTGVCCGAGAGDGAATRGAGRSGSCCQPCSGEYRQASLSHVRTGLPSVPGRSEAPPIIQKSCPVVAAVARMRGVPGQSGSRIQPVSVWLRSSVHAAFSAGAEFGSVCPPAMYSRFPTSVPQWLASGSGSGGSCRKAGVEFW